MRPIFTIAILCLVLFSCKNNKTIRFNKKAQTYRLGNPPGQIKIGSNLYIDKSELKNQDWIEYLVWLRRFYGKESTQYKNALPNDSIWNAIYPSEPGWQIDNAFFFHRNYPVVGISYQQAKLYSEWRTERVLEYILKSRKIIQWDSFWSDGKRFTIDQFYNNPKYKSYHFLPYPAYEMIPLDKWDFILRASDSVNRPHIKKCRQNDFLYRFGTEDIHCTDLIRDNKLVINSRELYTENNSKSIRIMVMGDHTVYQPSYCYSCYKRDIIFHLQGNVQEMTSDSTLCIGGSWKDPLESILKNQSQPNQAPNNYTGFRNICSWKKYSY